MRFRWSPPAPAPNSSATDATGPTWRKVEGELWTNGQGAYVVVGAPSPEEDESNPVHDCDAMGCSSVEHVLDRLVSTEQLAELREANAAAKEAIEYVLVRAREDSTLGYYLGPRVHAWEQLVRAYALLTGEDLQKVRAAAGRSGP